LCPVAPEGSDVLAGMDTSGCVVAPLHVDRSDEGVHVSAPTGVELSGACVVVVDAGVETGTVAREAAAALRQLEPAHLVLAVPVCPREVRADLQHRYDHIVAVVEPIARRALRWHYEGLDDPK